MGWQKSGCVVALLVGESSSVHPLLTCLFFRLPQHALTTFYGISRHTSARLCARLQLHADANVASLTDTQITALSGYLSSPGSIPAQRPSTTSAFPGASSSSSSSSESTAAATSAATSAQLPPSQRRAAAEDPLRSIALESDLRRQVRDNIAHHRNIGTYRGRRHMQGLPVRGQRTHTNARTAGKLNRIERRGMATMSSAAAHSGIAELLANASRPLSTPGSVLSLVRPLLRARFAT